MTLVAAIVAIGLGGGIDTPARAGKDDDKLRQMQEQARQAAERAAERAREAAERAREAAERARQAAEQARQQSESSRAQSSGTQSTQSSNSQSQSNSKSDDKSASSSASKSDSSDSGDKSSRSTSNARKPTKSDTSDKDDDEQPPPATIVEWLNRTKPAVQAKPPAAAAPGLKPATAAKSAPVVSVPPLSPKASPAVTAAKPVTSPAAKKPASALPNPFLGRAPPTEILAVNPSAAAMQRAQGLGFTVIQSTALPALDMQIQRLQPPPGMDAVTARNVLGLQGKEKSIQLNELYRPIRAATSDEADGPPQKRVPQAASTGGCAAEHCFGMRAIRWDKQLHRCTQGVEIGIIDTMVDTQHPTLHAVVAERRIATRSFIGKGRAQASSNHGTSILSLLAGGPSSGTPGLIPDARFSVADIFHADAAGQPFADTLSLLRALDWMDEKGIKIVNMSVAGPHDPLMEGAIAKLTRKGVIFVAAAGNEGPTAPPMYPAAYNNVIAVTAVAKDLRGYRRANRGDYIDVAAPGVDVWTAVPGAKENYQSGTSFAVPFATAVVATVYNQVKTKTKEAMLSAIEFKDLGLPGRDTVFGRGLMLAPAHCEAPDANVARAAPPRPTPTAAAAAPPPSGLGAGKAVSGQPSVGFGFASGKP